MTRVLFAAGDTRWQDYETPLRDAFTGAGLTVDLSTDAAPEMVDYIIYAPDSAVKDFRPFSRLKAVLNLWAGVEGIVGNDTLTVPLCRMVEDGLTEGMVEWVTGQVLRHHLGFDRYIKGTTPPWDPVFPPLARDRSVGILGLGTLGQACAASLAGLNFRVSGWSRSAKTQDSVATYHGANGLKTVLSQSEILVLLLPSTKDTENTLDARALALLPKGAVIINPGRGPLIDDDALLAALNQGQVSHATLDVFRREPLPTDHPFWPHPRITITPHVASETRAASAARAIAENIRRGETGTPYLHVVDRVSGY